MLTEILLIFVAILYFFWSTLFGKRPKKYPPGPMRLPIVGNLPLLGTNPLKTLGKWKEEYGPIVGMRFGDLNMVLLSGYEVIKEAFEKAELAGRPSIGPFLVLAGKEKRGLVVSEGKHWAEQRRFALKNLRDFGFGKKSMEGAILENASDFINVLKSKKGSPISTERMLSLVVLSALWEIIAGEKLAIDDPRAQDALNRISRVTGTQVNNGPVIFMPWLAQIFPKLSGWTTVVEGVKYVKDFIKDKIAEHKETRDPDNARDYMDVYLNEIEKTTDKDSSFYKQAGEENMVVGTANLFAAGAETTSSTLNWALYFLAKNPEVQKKMQLELDTVVGKNRVPALEDRDKLVYTEAVMQEVFRKSSIIPFGVFHSAMEDTTFRGFEIPKDCALMANVHDVHHDIKTWGDPLNFRPERFLTPDEKTYIKAGPVIPFLVGKRACLGETLARATFFLVLTSVVQRFNFSFDPNTPIDEAETFSLIKAAPTSQMIFKDRYD